MSAHMKKHLTSEDVKILVFGQEIELKKNLKHSFVNILNEIIDFESYLPKDVHGEWLNSSRMRAAKYMKGARKREGITQKEICEKTGLQQSNYSSMEKGERPIPKSLIIKLSKILNIKSKMINEDLIERSLKVS